MNSMVNFSHNDAKLEYFSCIFVTCIIACRGSGPSKAPRAPIVKCVEFNVFVPVALANLGQKFHLPQHFAEHGVDIVHLHDTTSQQSAC